MKALFISREGLLLVFQEVSFYMRNPADLAVKKTQQKPTKQKDQFFFSL